MSYPVNVNEFDTNEEIDAHFESIESQMGQDETIHEPTETFETEEEAREYISNYETTAAQSDRQLTKAEIAWLKGVLYRALIVMFPIPPIDPA